MQTLNYMLSYWWLPSCLICVIPGRVAWTERGSKHKVYPNDSVYLEYNLYNYLSLWSP